MKKNKPSSKSSAQPPMRGKPSRSPSRGPGNRSAPTARGPSQGRAPANAAPPKEREIPRDWRPVIGTHAIKEAIAVHSKMAKVLWLRQGWQSSQELREIQEFAEKKNIKIEDRAESVIDRFGPSHQGAVFFLTGAPEFSMESLDELDQSILLILDGIEDPHNLGAILRTSWLIGVQGIIIPSDRAVGLTPTVHKVACGGAEHVPVQTSTNFANYAEEFKKKGYWIYGLSPRGKKSIFDLQLPDKVVWAIGAEDKGMRVNTERLCDELVYLPQSSAAASYNASVATAMALTETLRQHSTSATNSGGRKK
ncbi:MAG: 23S rRNA (guanosine(2251)-2'-O)-methyltransferase RlmB [Bdellovibrionaceae bacterium]|nr:23S rRNA (guanosine(2251)-2'-O)-methyltransferase RlmB [Pseudobdellovibrionaceae bacterium]